MANRISFSILTDAPYSEKEKENLIDAFLEFISEEDPDIDVNSVEFDLVDTNSEDGEAEKIRQAAIELIQGGILTVKISAADENDDELFETDDVVITLKG